MHRQMIVMLQGALRDHSEKDRLITSVTDSDQECERMINETHE